LQTGARGVYTPFLEDLAESVLLSRSQAPSLSVPCRTRRSSGCRSYHRHPRLPGLADAVPRCLRVPSKFISLNGTWLSLKYRFAWDTKSICACWTTRPLKLTAYFTISTIITF